MSPRPGHPCIAAGSSSSSKTRRRYWAVSHGMFHFDTAIADSGGE